MIPRLLVAIAFVAAVTAQQTKVIPRGMDFVEGPSVSTTPFSAATSGIQFLIDANEIAQGTGYISAIRFRPSQVSGTQSSLGFTKNYMINMYTVPTTAAAFEALPTPYDPNLVIAGATPTLVFNGPVTFPAVPGLLPVTPAPFSIVFQFTAPYFYTPAQGNLLIMLETTDTVATPGTYRIDAVQFRETEITGIAAPIETAGCVVNGATITTTVDGTQVVDNGAINVTVLSAPPTAFPAAIVTLGLQRADIDLSILGLPGCTSRLGSLDFSQFAVATGGVYPVVSWPIPGDIALRGLGLVTQTLGLSGSGLFADSAVSNGVALRIGTNQLPPGITAMYGFRSGASWFHGIVGQFTPVVELEGLFP